MRKRHIFIIGSKGIPAAYGGFETFVEKLTAYQKSDRIRYHVAVLSDRAGEYEYHGARCFRVKTPEIGSAKAVWYDLAALWQSICYCKRHPKIRKPVFYILACRIGPFMPVLRRLIRSVGGTIYVNPDGHEWKRAKWNAAIRRYWKYSERGMVRHADLLICDSKNIEKYIKKEYARYKPATTFIAYGSETRPSALSDDAESWTAWRAAHGVTPGGYYLVVGRFVPENNYETMIREFMRSDTPRDFVLVTNVSDKFRDELEQRTGFRKDQRIKFVGTVYDQELLKKIRENACGYFHGHEVGGTNPSLLEALGLTDLNLLLNVGFNREVAGDGALYWNKTPGNLAGLIYRADHLSAQQIQELGARAKKRIRTEYTWDIITEKYENLFLLKNKGIGGENGTD